MGIAIADSYAETNQSSGVDLFTGSITRCGQSFTPSFSGTLDSSQFYLKKTGSPTGDIVSKLYAMLTNLGGNDDLPLNSVIASSVYVPTSGITGSYQLIEFSFPDELRLIKGINYVISVEYTAGDVSNLITVGYDNSASTHTGNQCTFVSSWAAVAADTCFYVYAEQLSNYSFTRGINKRVMKVGDGMGRSG
jgi:hypothetical protein